MPISSMPASRKLALLDHRERVGKGPRRIDVATDHQQPSHIGLAAQTGKQIMQVGGRAEAPGGDMDDGLKTGLAQRGRRGDDLTAAR